MYRFFVGYVIFAIFVAFILITSLQERGFGGPNRVPRYCNIYTLAMYTGDGDDEWWCDNWVLFFFWKIKFLY